MTQSSSSGNDLSYKDEMEVKEKVELEKCNGLVLKKPRHWIVESLLIFSTFGLFSSFWMAGRVSELRKLNKVNYRPWLWFFVPLFLLAQLIALPKFTAAVTKLGIDNNCLRKSNGLTNFIWILAVVVTTALFNFSDKTEIPVVIYILIVFLFSIILGLYHLKFFNIVKNIPDISFKKRNIYLVFFEWLIIITVVPFVVFLGYESSVKNYFSKPLSVLNENVPFVDIKNAFEITSNVDGWKRVSVGTYSDGTALHEFQGPLEDMYMLIFEHSPNTNVTEVSYWRLAEMRDELSSPKCDSRTYFEQESLDVVSFAYCDGKVIGNKAVSITKSITVDHNVYELYGYFSSVKNSFKNNRKDFFKMAKGFKKVQ